MTRQSGARTRGFTLIEVLVSMLVLVLVATLGLPALFQFIHRTKIEGFNRQAASLLGEARLEAIKRGVPTVVAIDPATDSLFSFVDIHGATLDDASDGLFNPLPAVRGTTDFELARLRLPSGVDFRFQAAIDFASVDGFVNSGNPDPPDKQAIYRSNGSVLDRGAFRFGDERGNYLEVRVSPESTARVTVRKWDGSQWRVFGEGGQPWKWQ